MTCVSTVLRLSICLLACSAIVACETISEKRKVDYRAARTLPPLEIPPDLPAAPAAASNPATAPSSATYSDLTTDKKSTPANPQATTVLPQIPDMRIERDSQSRWLLVQANPEVLWPRVREFVSSAGLIVDKENPNTGVIETDWAENRAKVGGDFQRFMSKFLGTLYSTDSRDKFRIRLEHGAQPGTTEIYVSHRGMEEVLVAADTAPNPLADKRLRWQPRPADPDLEVEMLRLMMVYLGKTDEQAKTLVAQAPPAPSERAHLTRRDNGVSLSLDDSLDRAWRRVGLSLDRIGFTVEDRDRSKGVYYVRYIDPDKADDRPGFFARMFGAEEKKNNEQYQIHLQTAAAGTDVAVMNKDGLPEPDKTGERILGLLYQQLK